MKSLQKIKGKRLHLLQMSAFVKQIVIMHFVRSEDRFRRDENLGKKLKKRHLANKIVELTISKDPVKQKILYNGTFL